MRRLEIADADIMRIAIQQEIVRSEESRYDHRLHGLLLITAGHSAGQVAKLFGEDRRTVQRWIKTFESNGLDGLREKENGLVVPKSLDARHGRGWARICGAVRQILVTRPACGTAAAVDAPAGTLWRHWVFGNASGFFVSWAFASVGPDHKWRSPIRPKSWPLKKNCAVWPKEDVELWSLDECHFQQHGTRCRMWVPPENKEPVLIHAPTRKSVACFGAVSL
ncbi:MAG: helix-turn-helix domain-containing protein [Hahellaceae bacterium]|nr:helix-turn-helix domain-containing protein [Hahellaceae bacterium]